METPQLEFSVREEQKKEGNLRVWIVKALQAMFQKMKISLLMMRKKYNSTVILIVNMTRPRLNEKQDEGKRHQSV